MLINIVLEGFWYPALHSDWYPMLLFGSSLASAFWNVLSYSVIRAYSVCDFEKCTTLFHYFSLLCYLELQSTEASKRCVNFFLSTWMLLAFCYSNPFDIFIEISFRYVLSGVYSTFVLTMAWCYQNISLDIYRHSTAVCVQYWHLIKVTYHIDGLAQDWSYYSLALSHRYQGRPIYCGSIIIDVLF